MDGFFHGRIKVKHGFENRLSKCKPGTASDACLPGHPYFKGQNFSVTNLSKELVWGIRDMLIGSSCASSLTRGFCLFVCVQILRPSQPNGVMSSVVSLPNHMFTGQALSSKRLTSTVHILSPETDNCPSWISDRERMTVENISQSISTKGCCRPRRGLNPRPPGLQSDSASNWATEAGTRGFVLCW